MIGGIDHVQLAAPRGCEPDARRFFGDLLGLEEVAKPEGVSTSGGVWFRCGEQELHIGIQDPFVPTRKGHPSLLVDTVSHLEQLATALADTGHAVDWDERIAGVRRFYTTDPWGNRIELRWLEPDGD